MAVAYCLHCGDRIYLGRQPWLGQAVYCDRCGADLEITRLHPLELDWTDYLVDAEQDQYGQEEVVPAWT